MRFKVLIEGYPNLGPAAEAVRIPAIPGTAQELLLDTRHGIGQTILSGFCEMRGIEAVDEESESSILREAVDVFCRFLAGEGSDNCNQVTRIECEDDEASPLIPDKATAFLLAHVLSQTKQDAPMRWKPTSTES